MQKQLCALAMAAVMLAGQPGLAQPLGNVAFSSLDPDTPVSGTLSVNSLTPNGDRLDLSLSAAAPTVLDQLDTLARNAGNLGSCEARLYWEGPTRVTSAQGDRADLTTRVRGEFWACSPFKTRLIRDTKTVDLALTPIWHPDPPGLSLKVEITNIHNVPGDFEAALRASGVRLSDELEVPLGDHDLLSTLAPQVHSLQVSAPPGAAGLTITTDLSLDRAAAQALMLSQFGMPALAGLLFRLPQ
ncbi:hypothetical protein [Falsiphaeobacter marinintestinus]|uniref:hypothetical protein n=1 Tax=Falsiphaeobacter marinintestinus TaxID=1492905 RepID=UPI0011B7186D|nr:hypothetical protein [Phaeobacter marinintestinus]